MRLTACMIPILVKNVSKRILFPSSQLFSTTASISSPNWEVVSQSNKHSCGCQKQSYCRNQRVLWDSTDMIYKSVPIARRFSANVPIDLSYSSIDINGATKARRTLDEVIYHLQGDIRKRRRIHKADIHNAIELVEKASKVDNFGSFLLSCCCDLLPDLKPSYRVELAERIWAVIQQEKDVASEHFESMLKVLAMNEDKNRDPVRYLDAAKSVGIKATGTMYYFAVLIVCQRGDLEVAVKILNTMKENNIAINERFFSALMLGYHRSGDFKGATDTLDVMRECQIEPSLHTWSTLLQIYIEMENLEALTKTFKDIHKLLTEDQYYELLKTAGRQTNSDISDLVIRHAVGSNVCNASSIMNISLQLVHLGHPKNALNMIMQFDSILKTKRETIDTFFIREISAANMDTNIYLQLVIALQKRNRNSTALNVAAESCLKHKKFDLAYSLFETMMSMNVPVRPHYFLPAFIMGIKNDGVNGGIGVLNQMRAMNVQPDWDILLNWIVPTIFHVEKDLQETLKVIKETSGLSYSSSGLLSAGLIVALKESKLDEGLKVVQKLAGKLSNTEEVMDALLMHICDIDKEMEVKSILTLIQFVSDHKSLEDPRDHIGDLIVKLLESDRCEEAELLLKGIAESRIPVSEAATEIVTNRMNFKGKLNVAANLFPQHLCKGISMFGDKDSLECHKLELESKDMNARGISRKLFLKYCATAELDKVLKSKESFEKEFGGLTRGMKSALMGAYIRAEVLEPALELFHELADTSNDQSDVVVDVYKIIDLATLMAKNEMIDEAVELILEKCPTRRVQRPEQISRNVVKLLDAVSQPNSDYVYNLTQLFLKLRFIKPTNPTLAPSIRDLIRKNKLEAAVGQLEQYTKQHHVCPCLQELTYTVLDNPELLDRVTKCSILIKGEHEAKRLLALARADMGDTDGAAKGFLELGTNLSFTSIINQCEYLSSKGDIKKVLNLTSALHKTGQNYDCRKLYDIAIQACTRSGNQHGLKQLLSSMEEQDLYISPKLNELVKSR